MKLLEFATKKNHFILDDQYYDQIDGVAMGSLLLPLRVTWRYAPYDPEMRCE